MKKILLVSIIFLGFAPLFTMAENSCPVYSLEQTMVAPSDCGSEDFQRRELPMYLRLVALEARITALETENKTLQDQQNYQSNINVDIYSKLTAMDNVVKTFAIQIIQVLTAFNKVIGK